jgi:transposase
MEVIRAWKFRIYPTGKQRREIQTHLWLSKNLWNSLLEYAKNRYNKTRKFPTKTELQSLVKDSGLYSQTAQAVSHRLYGALLRFLRMKKEGGGFPRFKSIDRMKSLLYPQSGFSFGKKLKVTPFGEISIRQVLRHIHDKDRNNPKRKQGASDRNGFRFNQLRGIVGRNCNKEPKAPEEIRGKTRMGSEASGKEKERQQK